MQHVQQTPVIVVDQAILDANIAAMADFAAANNLVLRPHAKTHKMAEVARRQVAAGSPGLSVATVGEAQYFFDAGVTDLFISYPLWRSEERRVGKECRAQWASDGKREK